MKKRLLITSIVMMLVVAVALSTATYAWFTSNATVSATSISLTAGVNEADALGIGWLGGDAGTSIDAKVSGTLAPMAPATLSGSTKTGATSGNVTFSTKTTKQEDSVIVFNTGDAESVDPITFGNGTVNAFYVKNLSPANTVSKITVTARFTGDATSYALASGAYISTEGTYFTKAANSDAFIPAAPSESDYNATVNDGKSSTYYVATTTANNNLDGNDMIRVAIFKKPNNVGTNSAVDGYTLLGVLGQTATDYTAVSTAYDKNTTYYTRDGAGTTQSPYVYSQVSINAFADGTTYYTATDTAVYGTITGGTAVKTLYNYEVKTSLDLTTNLAPGAQVDIVALVWLDGAMLTDSRQGDIGNVSLEFNAA